MVAEQESTNMSCGSFLFEWQSLGLPSAISPRFYLAEERGS